jgi:tyramine---L-glutamate ligase
LKVLVYEHVSGGGYAEQPIPLSVLAEGFGMLRSVVADFTAAGHEVTVLMDVRIAKLHPPIDAFCILPVNYAKEFKKFLKNLATINDAIYIIAPETASTLQSLVELVEKTGKTSLNCETGAIKSVADKGVLHESLQKNGFPTPKMLVLKRSDSLMQIKQAIKQELSYPVVVKPVDGVGCGGLSIVKQEAQLESAIDKVKAESKNACFIAQEFIKGDSASVSLLSNGKKAIALSLNKQNVNLAGPDEASSYEGGTVPFEYWLKQDVFKVAEKVVEGVSGLRGYVGVDFVLTEHKAYVVEVNPRLTTSYIGLRKVAGFNVAEALMDAVVNCKLPTKHENRGYACFSKIETPTPTVSAFQEAAKSGTVISPPFPLNEDTKSYAVIIGNGDSLDDVQKHLEEAKKQLLIIIS